MINTLTHFTNGSSSCNDFVFSSSTSYLTTGIAQSIYESEFRYTTTTNLLHEKMGLRKGKH